MGRIVNLNEKIQFDPTEYKPISVDGTLDTVNGTLFSVIGSGFITNINVSNVSSGTPIVVTIILDGEIVYKGNLINTGQPQGFIQSSEFVGVGTNARISIRYPGIVGLQELTALPKAYPLVNLVETDGVGGFILIDNPIFFKEGLLVTVVSTATTRFSIRGGIKS